ncbi:P-loop containing nucleoside triphosphate hydrolase protein, partial [Rhizophagus diaphanus]
SRYERSKNRWNFVQTLTSSRGLDSVALNESQENLLKKELETFANDKSFYERIGVPYRRGILLYGKPGTGKTSLINAISSQLSRDIYYLNLKDIKNDNELNAAFSGVPGNQIIVLEDVDTQSKVLHKLKIDAFAEFSLSTFLGCLDGHILAEGNIIIMTTNHVEHLDPACIRPGRMDVQLNLGYCTHYQIEKMYKSVVENPEAKFPHDILEKIPENLLPPCEVMMTMI